MHNEQLVIMFVGGPNQREDYHIEEGEELFYQLKGDMCVKIIENGKHRDVHIKEGEFFVLPGRIPHSPQRTAGSIGLVIERKRLENEKDGVRWFVPNSTDVLYEKWFNCKDLGVELIPLIKNYFASEEFKTKIPGNNVLDKSEYPFELNNVVLDLEKHGPYKFDDKIKSDSSKILNLTPDELSLQFEILVLKTGEHVLEDYLRNNLDVWLWQLSGTSQLSLKCLNNNSEEKIDLNLNDSVLVEHKNFSNMRINVQNDSQLLLITQNPNKKV
ncbi:unnamed protein product [Brachionus calyciflorus]|uniref:3-hydroxyanthranilate 3,4-dioxygenase n=1 Tax=Brachionus calyciflorus TaxID=104777 RepID=A0A813MZI4_9BILA|nr:unnamed protein product [Brachionus calyciflorus]